MNIRILFYSLILFFLAACQTQPASEFADLILLNGNIYTVDNRNPTVEAIAIMDGEILALGKNEEVQKWKGEGTKVIDLDGKFVMPGFIEGHGHFSGLGNSLMNLNFLKSKNWNEIVAQVAEKAKDTPSGEWISGRGWHQEKWNESLEKEVLGYPYHDKLSSISPDNPVILFHASGHSLFANEKAMELAGITIETPNPAGGEIVRDAQGEAVGVFEETAMGLLYGAYMEYESTLDPEEKDKKWRKAIALAQKECLSKGVTSFQDAGSSYIEIEKYKKMAEDGELDLRLWAMLRHSYDKMNGNMKGFPIINAGNSFFTCRAIKSEIDGALGSYGAWLLAPYMDKPGFVGQNTTPVSEVENIANLAMENDMQLCVHAIGDKGNQQILDICEAIFKANPEKKNLRWRIEHAQHLDVDDIPRFKELGVIAAMQAVHCTSDAPFVVKRLGEHRAKTGAYAWRSLLDSGAIVTNGTDTPVEDVNPLESFYASVTRKRADTGLEFFTEQAMTREEAIYSYTMACAYSAFEENEKGSLEKGKMGDLVVLSNDLINCAADDILKTEVLMTIVGGEVKFER